MKFLRTLSGPLGAGGGAFIIAFASSFSYLFGMARDLVLAHFFGASRETDAFATAFLIPDFIFNLFIAGAITGVLMPVLVGTEKESKKDGENLFFAFITVMNVIVAAVSVGAFFLSPWVVAGVFSAADAEQQRLVVGLTRILLLSPVLFGISNTLGSLLIGKKRFLSFAVAPIFYNLGILLGIFFLADDFGIYSAAWGAAFGVFLHAVVRLWDFYALRIPWRFSFDWRAKNFGKVIRLAIPKTIGLLAFQGMIWGINYAGYFLADGSIAAFNFARNIQSFAVSLFGISLATAVSPFLADFSAEKDNQKFVHRLEKSARQILFFALPSCLGIIVLSVLLTKVIFGRGAFDAHDIALTASVLTMIALAIPFESLTHLFARAFLAREETILPTIGQIIFFVVASGWAFIAFMPDIVLFDTTFSLQPAADFVRQAGIRLFGLSFAIATFLQCLFLMIAFHRKGLRFPFGAFLRGSLPIAALTALMTVAVWLTMRSLAETNDFLNLAVSFLVGCAVYFFGAFLGKMPEVERAAVYLRARFSKKR